MTETLLSIYLFYLGFALSVSIYRQWIKGTLNVLNKILFAPVLIIFIILDFLINVFLVALMGIPPKGGYTISSRFELYRKQNYGWKSFVATFVCEKLLNTVDPTGQHC